MSDNLSRRRLVQGAAWSVPAVALGSAAPAMASSPCNIFIFGDCEGGRATFSYTIAGAVPAGPLVFTLSRRNLDEVQLGTGASLRGTTLTLSPVAGTGVLISFVKRGGNDNGVTFSLTLADSPCGTAQATVCVGRGSCC